MEKNTKVILIFFIAITILVAIMYFSVNKTSNNRNESDVVNISAGFFPWLGLGEIKIIEFSDFACPVCKIQEPILKQLLVKYENKVKLYYRNFPLTMHKNSFLASLASMCANEQNKFWEYHDVLFENQNNLDDRSLKIYAKKIGLNSSQFDECLNNEKYKDEINGDVEDGKKVGVKGTPTFFINNRKYEGFQDLENFRNFIEEISDSSQKSK